MAGNRSFVGNLGHLDGNLEGAEAREGERVPDSWTRG